MRDGAEELFREMYADFAKPVYSYFLACFAGKHTAEDLTQDVYEKVWRRLSSDKYFIPVCARAWVFRIAVNVKNDYLRRLRSARENLSGDGYDDGVKYADCVNYALDVKSGEDCDGTALCGAETETDTLLSLSVREALGLLGESDREMLMYKKFGLSGEETAKILNIPSSTARSRISAAKKRFLLALEACGVDTGGYYD